MPLVHFTIQQEYRGLSRIGRSLTAAYGGAPNIRNYDKKKQKLIDNYSLRVEKMVTDNNGIIAYDNWCNVYGSPHLSTERDTAYVKSNFTVVGVSRYNFQVRPKFAWRWIDEKVAVTSVPRDLEDLKAYENKVILFLGYLGLLWMLLDLHNDPSCFRVLIETESRRCGLLFLL